MSFNFDADRLLNDVDKNLKESREIFQNFENKFKSISEEEWTALLQKAVQREHNECSICMNHYEIPKVFIISQPCLLVNFQLFKHLFLFRIY
jgi:hypothetical protein